MKIHINPTQEQASLEGGIGQVIHAQYKHLPAQGIEFTSPEAADLIISHVNKGPFSAVDIIHCHGLYWADVSHSPFSWHNTANREIVDAIRSSVSFSVPSRWVADAFRRDMRLTPWVIGHGVELDRWGPGEDLGFIFWAKNRRGDVCDPTPALELANRGLRVVSTFTDPRRPLPDSMMVTGLIHHADMPRVMGTAGIYLSTTPETFGIGILEALASGVPVLGYRWGGIEDIVRDGVEGILVDPGDIEGLIRGAETIQKNRASMGKAARKRAEDFTWSKVMESYAAMYQEALDLKKQEAQAGVTVVIPSHNYGKYLEDCYKSLLLQRRPPEEVIIVDDASTDETKDVVATLQSWKSEKTRLVYVRNEQNQGVAKTRNIGIQHADNPYIVCLDADDLLHRNFIETCFNAIRKDRGIGIVYTGLVILNADGSTQPTHWPPPFDWDIQATVSNPPSTCVPSACMFRKDLWARGGGYKQLYAPGEDAEFYTRGLSIGYKAEKVSDDGLFVYRVHEGSASRTKKYSAVDMWHPWMRDKIFPMGAPSKKPVPVFSYLNPPITVIIPVGPGHDKYLPGALDSLLGQSFRLWKCIVVNDTGKDIPCLSDSKEYVFVNELKTDGGRGAGAARNAGIRAAKSPLILFLDADDYLDPEALKEMTRAYIQGGGRYIYSDYIAVEKNGAHVGSLPEYDPGIWLDSIRGAAKGIHGVTVLMERKHAEKILFDETLPGWEEVEFFIRGAIMGIHGKRVPKPLFYYRIHTGQRREYSAGKQAELEGLLQERFSDYLKGSRKMSSCCGGGGNPILEAKKKMGLIESETTHSLTPEGVETAGTIRMEYIGDNLGPISVTVNGRVYQGAKSPFYRYCDADPRDVERLEAIGRWRRVDPEMLNPTIEPEPTPWESIETAMRKNSIPETRIPEPQIPAMEPADGTEAQRQKIAADRLAAAKAAFAASEGDPFEKDEAEAQAVRAVRPAKPAQAEKTRVVPHRKK